MFTYRYSRWDGTQELADLSPDDVLAELSDPLLTHGDISQALRNLIQRGMRGRQGSDLKGIQDLLQRLRQARQQQLDNYDLGSSFEDIKKRLEDIVNTERQGIDKRLEDAQKRFQDASGGQPQAGAQGQDGAEGAQSAEGQQGQEGGQGQEGQLSQEAAENLLKFLERTASQKQSFLNELPKDPAGQIKELSEYEFMDPDAKQKFDELMKMLQQSMMDSFYKNLSQQIQNLTPEDMKRIREMAQDLNLMLQEKMKGGQPDFNKFMQKHGQMFGDNPPQSLEELVERMQHSISQMQSLLDSLTPEQRQNLRQMLESSLKNQGLSQELALLAANLEQLMPMRQLRQRYPFQGEESLSLQEAMELMDKFQAMDELERQLRRVQQGQPLSNVDEDKLREIMGEEDYQAFEALKRLTELLEKAGYIEKKGNKYELTPRGMRKIGQKALDDIFALLKKDRYGKHPTKHMGVGGERADDTKRYQFGDPFHLHLERTIMNSMFREAVPPPVRLDPDDFEVYKTEYLTQSSTVLMLDMSLSMFMRNYFEAAKRTIIALDCLIRSQFPKDNLYIVGFSRYARELKNDELPYVRVNEFDYGTNIQHGLMIAQRLLSKNAGGTKQILIISDGEPTAHMEGTRAYFQYPPSSRTIQETLREVRRCTMKGIVINIFMLEQDYYLTEFVNYLTKINKGRAFFTSPERLGQYILVDYVNSKKKRISS